MLKILDVHPSVGAQGEYVVLQNTGLITISLRGWALCTDAYLEGDAGRIAKEMYIFREDIPIRPYTRVVLFTGQGKNDWLPTIDGKQAYCAYWGRSECIWSEADNVHVLQMSTTRRVIPPHSQATASA